MKIGIISDTHGVFSPEFKEFFSDVDEIWHAGDFGGGLDTAAEIAAFKPLVGVCGNCDSRDLLRDYPLHQFFVREGLSVLMTHIGGHPAKYDLRARALIEQFRPNIFVCGHSHILRVENDSRYDMLTINPGAAGHQGWQVERTALRFCLQDGKISDMELFRLPK